jgi:hypothetical protein
MGKSYTKIKLTLPIKKSPTDYFPNRARETRKRAEQEVIDMNKVQFIEKPKFSMIMFGKFFFILSPLPITSCLHPLLLLNQT